MTLFQSTPPRRWWRITPTFSRALPKFQSTPPRRWWQYRYDGNRGLEHFNPHHHAGGDRGGGRHRPPVRISIHTTTQVVTFRLSSFRYTPKSFQSTPPRRWWPYVVGRITDVFRFQSTPPRRWWRDDYLLRDNPQNYFNPHHHAGGDVGERTAWPDEFNFNPHHHAGGDCPPPAVRPWCNYFNPHHHAGGDNNCMTATTWCSNFNPHHHAGGDPYCPVEEYYPQDFNPHHHAGGDPSAGYSVSRSSRFQSTPPRRWWRQRLHPTNNNSQFQSTPPRRWWQQRGTIDGYTPKFQSTPPRRWWLKWRIFKWKTLNFNPHHHAGGDAPWDWGQITREISIHTTTQVVTFCCLIRLTVFANFNPHHHAGGDR